MDFREFATNYLNPIFLLYRATLLTVSFFIFILSWAMFIKSASRTDIVIVLVMSLVLTVGLYVAFRRRAYLLYLIIPFIFVTVGFSIRGDQVVQEGILKIPMAMWWTSAFLIAFNGFRSWGYGMSINDINNMLNKLQK